MLRLRSPWGPLALALAKLGLLVHLATPAAWPLPPHGQPASPPPHDQDRRDTRAWVDGEDGGADADRAVLRPTAAVSIRALLPGGGRARLTPAGRSRGPAWLAGLAACPSALALLTPPDFADLRRPVGATLLPWSLRATGRTSRGPPRLLAAA